MCKFSIIIPVYNTEKYIKKCIDSILFQDNEFTDYEIIIVNDGSTDGSEKIIKQYSEFSRIKYFFKENGGVSSARNYGVEKSKGDYLFFVDSDDYIESDLLINLVKCINKNNSPDLIRINSRDVKEDGTLIKNVIIEHSESDIQLIKNIMAKNSLEVPWGYIIKRSFFIKNKFTFLKKVHEDFGLIPIIIYKANSIVLLPNIGYNYVEREGSLTAEQDYSKLIKRVDDLYFYYIKHMEIIKDDSIKGKLLRSYSLEAMCSKFTTLNKKDMIKKFNKYKNSLNYKDFYCYNFNKFLKKIIFMINKKIYLMLYKKYKKVGE